VVVAYIFKCTTNLSSETAAALSAKIRATIIWLQTPVQFPGASAVYPSSISRQPNGHKAIFDITNSLIGENVAASEIIATFRPINVLIILLFTEFFVFLHA
jgi:hypothetical protein